MVWLYIIIGILGFILLSFIFLFIIVFISYNKEFNKRFESPKFNTYSKDYFHLDYKKIEIGYKDKYIRGELYNYQNFDDNKLIIFCHGMNSSKESYIQEIEYFARNGYRVLGFDYFGTEDSDGVLEGFGNSIKSLDIVINYLKNNNEFKNKEIYVVGHSWGGEAALEITKFHKDIKKIVALAPAVSFYKLLRGMGRSYIISLMILLIEKIKFGKYGNINIIKSLDSYNGDVMVIQSRDDYQVSFSSSLDYLRNNLKRDVDYLVVDDRGHNPDYTANAAKLVKEFFTNINKYSGKELEEYINSQNFYAMGELDNIIMDKIIDFLKK